MIRHLEQVRAPICGVFAIALATPDMPFCVVKNVVHDELGLHPRWTGALTLKNITDMLKHFGVTFTDESIKDAPLKTVVKDLSPSEHHLIFVKNHFLTAHDGKCYDQGNARGTPIEQFWCAGRNVQAVIKIDRSKPAKTYADLFPDE